MQTVLVKYAKNMQRKYAKICLNMQVICRYLLKICRYSEKYARNMQEICIYIYIQTVLVKNAKTVQRKYAEICSFICNICRNLYIAYFVFTCTPHFAHASLLSHNSQNYDLLGPSELLQLELLCQCTGSWHCLATA